MKVIEGSFGQETADTATLKEALLECLEYGECGDAVGARFLVMVDLGDRYTFMANQTDLGQLMLMSEMVKQSIITAVQGVR